MSPTSATATDFRVRGGRYRRPRQKSAAHFGDRDRFQSKGRPVSATVTKKKRTRQCSANRDKRRQFVAIAVRRTRRPRQKSVALFGDRDKFQNEGRPVSATATKKCRPLRRPLQKSVADFGDRDFGKCDKKVRTLSPKSARAVRGMVQPSIDSFRRANKRFQFSLLRTLLTRVT